MFIGQSEWTKGEKRVAFQIEIWGPTIPPLIKWAKCFFFWVKDGQGVKLTIQFHYVPRLIINGALPS